MDNEKSPARKNMHFEDENIPLWIRIFGGSILSITFLCVITLTGYIVTNINSLQSQVNLINTDMITKKDFQDRQKSLWDLFKTDSDMMALLKEKMNLLDQAAKDRQTTMDKYEIKISDQNKNIEIINKEIASLKEKSNSIENQIVQMREESKNLQNSIQAFRERVAAIEGKKKE
jgi:chromosome segregation ATPase